MPMTPDGAPPVDAYQRLRQAIVEGRYRPGERLVEQRIGEELRISRTPVREAIRRLEAEGLVLTERNRGAVVRSVTSDEIHDLYDLRARLESACAEQAAARAEPEELDLIRAAVQEFHEASLQVIEGDLKSTRRLSGANHRFHDLLVQSARNQRLAVAVARTVDIPLVFQALRSFDRSRLARSDLFHQLIFEAVAAKEPARAGRLMTEHILQGRDTLLARLAQEGGDGQQTQPKGRRR